MDERIVKNMLKDGYFMVEIFSDKSIQITEQEIPGFLVGTICGQNQAPRIYKTTWHCDKNPSLHANIYISGLIKNPDEILGKLDHFLEDIDNSSSLIDLSGLKL